MSYMVCVYNLPSSNPPRLLYPVDKSRPNEFGQCGDTDEVDSKPNKTESIQNGKRESAVASVWNWVRPSAWRTRDTRSKSKTTKVE
ncbi:hypothetical protein PHET_01799 [Paragonimus heterotremus]|uniref:Uncharacterized protein n=1 Tax=Paragonimus heterotremus TaxID=100268 RepID=A0A8J4WJ69_9TREM|nr:hypothetical protein PHET_01799 [Paragonimus heterotremus]